MANAMKIGAHCTGADLACSTIDVASSTKVRGFPGASVRAATWLEIISTPTPAMYPIRIGLPSRSPTNPKRSTAASTARAPTISASSAASAA